MVTFSVFSITVAFSIAASNFGGWLLTSITFIVISAVDDKTGIP
jgi:hypothetical protein